MERVLVILDPSRRLFAHAAGALAGIRAHHAAARVTCLCPRDLADVVADAGYADDIWMRDDFRGMSRVRLWRHIIAARFTRVYDFTGMTAARWAARGGYIGLCYTPAADVHPVDFYRARLAAAGVDILPPDLSRVRANLDLYNVQTPYVLLIPGTKYRARRFPAVKFAALAIRLSRAGMGVVLLGTAHDLTLIDTICRACPSARALTGMTTLSDIVTLARGAAATVSNEIGAGFVVAATGCHTVILMAGSDDPLLRQPRGRSVQVIQSLDIADIPVDVVFRQTLPAPEAG